MTAPAEEGSAFVPLLGLGLEFVAVLHKSCPPFFKFEKFKFFKLENSKKATTPLTSSHDDLTFLS